MLVGDHFRSVLSGGEGGFLWSEHDEKVSVELGPATTAVAEAKEANLSVKLGGHSIRDDAAKSDGDGIVSIVMYTILFIYPRSGLRAICCCYLANGFVKLECKEARTRIDRMKLGCDTVTKRYDTTSNVDWRFT